MVGGIYQQRTRRRQQIPSWLAVMFGVIILVVVFGGIPMSLRIETMLSKYSIGSLDDDSPTTSAKTIKVVQVLNLYANNKTSETPSNTAKLPTDQWITLHSIRDALNHRNTPPQLEVTIVCAILESDFELLEKEQLNVACDNVTILPRSTKTDPPLYNVLSAGSNTNKWRTYRPKIVEYFADRELPYVQDILQAGITHARRLYGVSDNANTNDGFYVMLTNGDIGLTRGFYRTLYDEIHKNSRQAFQMNRLTIPTTQLQNHLDQYPQQKGDSTTLATKVLDAIHKTSLQHGEKHPGNDCFLMHSSIVDNINVGYQFPGFPAWSNYLQIILKGMLARSSYAEIESSSEGTFHLGDDRNWANKNYDSTTRWLSNHFQSDIDTCLIKPKFLTVPIALNFAACGRALRAHYPDLLEHISSGICPYHQGPIRWKGWKESSDESCEAFRTGRASFPSKKDQKEESATKNNQSRESAQEVVEPEAETEVETEVKLATEAMPESKPDSVPELVTAQETVPAIDSEPATESVPDTKPKTVSAPESPVATDTVQTVKPLPSLIEFTYGTADVNEFKKLHREYLVKRQNELSNNSTAQKHLSTKAWSHDEEGNNVTTYSVGRHFVAGFRNQIMALTMLVARANQEGHKQFLLDSLQHKDTYGSNKIEPFDFWFDVEHWNSFVREEDNEEYKETDLTKEKRLLYPNRLPRMVMYDPVLHDQWDLEKRTLKVDPMKAERPYGYDKIPERLAGNFMFYAKGKGKYAPNQDVENLSKRNPAEILMAKGALKPHPGLQAIVDRSKDRLREAAFGVVMAADSNDDANEFRYMTLHARVEPDMQHHVMCKDKKVLTLREIVDMIESKWPNTPPVEVVFLPINRQYLEKEVREKGEENKIAVENLELLNRLTNHKGINNDKDGVVSGMWNGRVPVVEFGSEALEGTVYQNRPSMAGSILNYFLSLDAHIFIGTEVSSYSHDVLAARFFRGVKFFQGFSDPNTPNALWNLRQNNFKYLPGRLEEWVTEDMIDPPGFGC